MDSTTVLTLLSNFIVPLIVSVAGLLTVRNARLKDKAEFAVKLAAIKSELTVKLAEVEADKIKDKALAAASNLDLESRLTDQVLERATKENARLSLRVITLENAITIERNARHSAEDDQEKIRASIALLQNTDRERAAGYSTIESSLITANMSVATLMGEVATLRVQVLSLTDEVAALKAVGIVKDNLITELGGDPKAATP